MDKQIVMRPKSKIVEEVPMAEALKRGLMLPARRSGGRRIPPVPAGMGVFAKWAIQVVDKAGKVVPVRHPKTGKMVRKIEAPVHSFTRQFGLFIRGFLMNLDSALNQNETLTDDTGASFQCRLKSVAGMSGTLAIVTGLGKMKFGNSSAPLDNTQTNLQGALLGPTNEATVSVNLVVEDSSNTIFTVSGQLTNGLGGNFTVEEMGLFAELNDTAGGTNRTTMMLRDLTGSVVVGNTQTIIGTYTFTIAV